MWTSVFRSKLDTSGVSLWSKAFCHHRNEWSPVCQRKALTLLPTRFALIFRLCQGDRSPFNSADNLKWWMRLATAVIRNQKDEEMEHKNCSQGKKMRGHRRGFSGSKLSKEKQEWRGQQEERCRNKPLKDVQLAPCFFFFSFFLTILTHKSIKRVTSNQFAQKQQSPLNNYLWLG